MRLIHPDGDDITIGDRVEAVVAGGFLAVIFMLAAIIESVWGDDDA